MQAIGVIPARYASTRFPGKPLVRIGDKTMIERVYRQAEKASLLSEVWVATDDERIFDHVKSFGGKVQMTSNLHASGTDRCAEVARHLPNAGIFINIQGDEPFIVPAQIDKVVQLLLHYEAFSIGTLVKRIEKPEELFNPNVVKAVFSEQGKALYFSRSTIPYLRGVAEADWMAYGVFYKHIGLYGYRRETLLQLADLPSGKLERTESLEQLRWLEHGYAIGIAETELETAGIDTPEDLEKSLAWIQNHLT